MITKNLCSIIMAGGIFSSACLSQTSIHGKILLKDNWAIQSSREIKEDGKIISTPEYQTEKWYPATVPSTVVGTLVQNKVFPDPYYGTNIFSLPGYPVGKGSEIPETSPFKVAWWYRTVFRLPVDFKGMNTWLKFHSINYKANIWLNGHLIADTTSIEGAYRLYNLHITEFSLAGEKNCLALEIFPPKGTDLTITWVDWNPTPPDRGMGIWYDVSINASGLVAIENTRVISKLNLPSSDLAKLTISTELFNTSDQKITGTLEGKIGEIRFSQEIILAPHENRPVVFTADTFKQLEISHPRLWWPHTAGPQNLYDLVLTFEIKNQLSDSKQVRFGIREIGSWVNNFDGKRTRIFQINGKNIVIRGGGYVEDMLLRPSEKRIDTDIQYAKHLGLNALRMEAPRGSDYLFDKCDEEGILVMVGWCCCSSWERWDKWTPHVADIAEKSWKDLIVRLRNHPAVFDWLYGSDNFPPADIEKRYIRVLDEYDGTRPYQSSATQESSTIAGYTGLWMGPYPMVYSYRSPSYWYGKLEFNTEAGPSGEQIPPLESLRKMMPENDLWPISDSWNIRLHRTFFPEAREALILRYGEPKGVAEYCMKSQVLQYEATRAMFEAFTGNKYQSSGIIYWMYNSAWPTMYWQLYDYYFTPNGAFYGTKKACEALHIQYSYSDSSIQVVNNHYQDFQNLKANVRLYDFNLEEKYSTKISLDVTADESKKVLFLDWPENVSDVFFLKLGLLDQTDQEISSNFYWLSTKGDTAADFKNLNTLPRITLNLSVYPLRQEEGRYSTIIEIENPSSSLAFFINPKIIKHDSKDLLVPIFWEDNYFSLLPKEKRKVKVEFNPQDLNGELPVLEIDGWNITRLEAELK